VFTVSDKADETNAVTSIITMPAASKFNLFRANVYNTYLAFTPDPSKGIYDQKRTGVKSIGMDELFANIDNGYTYFIHMDVTWSKTTEPKLLTGNVLVMRAPDGSVFAWGALPFVFEGRHERFFFSSLLNEHLEWYRSNFDMEPGTYAFEYYTDGMLVGKASMRIN